MAENVGGGSLLIAWQLKEKNVLIVGGGEVASQRIQSILVTDAHITVIAPADGLHPRSRHLIDQHGDRIKHHDRLYTGRKDLDGMDMVLTALDDVELSRNICNMCRAEQIPVNAADIPDSCDFYFGSQIRDGPLQIMISTNGNGPKMANLVKKKLEKALSGVEGQAITKVGELRAKLKIRAPGVGGDLGKKRMKWMIGVCNAWEMEELASLDHSTMQKLLEEGWEKDHVPSLNELKTHRQSFFPSNLSASCMSLSPAIGFAAGVLCTCLVVMFRRK